MKRRPTLKDLADATGVSITTASNAFSRPDQLSDELRHLVLRAADRLGYRGPAAEGRLRRTGHAGAIALYAREPLDYLLNDAGAASLLGAVAALCQERQQALVMLPSIPYAGGVGGRLPAALDVTTVDGFLAYCLPDGDRSIERIVARDRPIVGIDMSPDPRFVGVNIDDRGGARLAAEHVLARGRTRPAVLSLPVDADRGTGPEARAALARAPFPVTRERWLGYADALRSAGMAPHETLVAMVGANVREEGRRATIDLLNRTSQRPDALLAMTDVLALGALDACAESGLAVPGDISVVGFDDVGHAAAAAGLTTVRQDVSAKATAAVRALLDASSEPVPTLRVTLVIRGTS